MGAAGDIKRYTLAEAIELLHDCIDNRFEVGLTLLLLLRSG